MPSVNWDQPSEGLVSDPKPALALKNDNDGALVASSERIAVDAESLASVAVRARTKSTLAAAIVSEKSAGLFAFAPKSLAAVGASQSASIAVAGVSTPDPAIPDPTQNVGGIGVAGLSDRFASIGVAGIAQGGRSVGVHGEAISGVGVRAIGLNGGVDARSRGGDGVLGVTYSGKAAGVSGVGVGNDGSGVGVLGQSATDAGVEGSSQAGPGMRATSETAEGVLAQAKASNAAGVRAWNDHQNGVGVDASSQKGVAVRAITNSGTGIVADAWEGRAVDASNISQTEPAVYAYAPVTSAVEAYSWGGPGVKTLGKTGLDGASISAPQTSEPKVGAGVYGNSTAGSGVCGFTAAGVGVLGIGHPKFGAWAGCFRGNVWVDGTILKQASLFSIDHPLDPDRKVLNHAAVEAPEHKTFYDGTAKLNSRGRARVRMPKWFAALNDVGALRYQLTPIGAPAPYLHVAQKMEDGAFSIAGGAPGQRVSWQVTGVRQDAFAKANPVVVEQRRRAARPSAANPTPQEIEAFAAELNQAGQAVKREGLARRQPVRDPRFPTSLPRPVRRRPGRVQPTPGAAARATLKTLARFITGKVD